MSSNLSNVSKPAVSINKTNNASNKSAESKKVEVLNKTMEHSNVSVNQVATKVN